MTFRESPRPRRALLFLTLALTMHYRLTSMAAAAGSWCIARSGASQTALQTSLDYACGSGADCGPIQPSGLCYLPNTVQAHASYAFNSYYQRSNYAPGSCDFAGTATATITDPSYGSCTYPSSSSSAGGVLSPPAGTTPIINAPATSTTTPPNTTPTTFPTNSSIFGGGGGIGAGGLSPGFGPSTMDGSSAGINSPHLPSLCLLFIVAVWFLQLCSFDAS